VDRPRIPCCSTGRSSRGTAWDVGGTWDIEFGVVHDGPVFFQCRPLLAGRSRNDPRPEGCRFESYLKPRPGPSRTAWDVAFCRRVCCPCHRARRLLTALVGGMRGNAQHRFLSAVAGHPPVDVSHPQAPGSSTGEPGGVEPARANLPGERDHATAGVRGGLLQRQPVGGGVRSLAQPRTRQLR